MREFQQEGLISCQIAYYPLGTADYNSDVDSVIEILKNSGVFCEIGEMSTIIKGSQNAVFSVLQRITAEMNRSKYVLNVCISNVCACEVP